MTQSRTLMHDFVPHSHRVCAIDHLLHWEGSTQSVNHGYMHHGVVRFTHPHWLWTAVARFLICVSWGVQGRTPRKSWTGQHTPVWGVTVTHDVIALCKQHRCNHKPHRQHDLFCKHFWGSANYYSTCTSYPTLEHTEAETGTFSLQPYQRALYFEWRPALHHTTHAIAGRDLAECQGQQIRNSRDYVLLFRSKLLLPPGTALRASERPALATAARVRLLEPRAATWRGSIQVSSVGCSLMKQRRQDIRLDTHTPATGR